MRAGRKQFSPNLRISLSSAAFCWNIFGWEAAMAREKRILGEGLKKTQEMGCVQGGRMWQRG
jgi:hypothetical protein